MSLLDTIKGAREEAAAGRVVITKDEPEATEETPAPRTSGYGRRSAANAKPVREAAGSVRSEASAKDPKNMSKAERKAAREERRKDDDIAYDATQVVLKQQPGYTKLQNIWWILMIVGAVLAVISFVLVQYMRAVNLQSAELAYVSIVCMVLAYVIIIGDFIFDIVKIRPMRKRADELMAGMTKKRMRKVVEDEARRKQQERAAKAAEK